MRSINGTRYDVARSTSNVNQAPADSHTARRYCAGFNCRPVTTTATSHPIQFKTMIDPATGWLYLFTTCRTSAVSGARTLKSMKILATL